MFNYLNGFKNLLLVQYQYNLVTLSRIVTSVTGWSHLSPGWKTNKSAMQPALHSTKCNGSNQLKVSYTLTQDPLLRTAQSALICKQFIPSQN